MLHTPSYPHLHPHCHCCCLPSLPHITPFSTTPPTPHTLLLPAPPPLFPPPHTHTLQKKEVMEAFQQQGTTSFGTGANTNMVVDQLMKKLDWDNR